jgi:hypothetical protein
MKKEDNKMKLNKTICLSEEAFKRSMKMDNFSKWVEGKLIEPDITEGRQLGLRARIKDLLTLLHRGGIDCEDARCDICFVRSGSDQGFN